MYVTVAVYGGVPSGTALVRITEDTSLLLTGRVSESVILPCSVARTSDSDTGCQGNQSHVRCAGQVSGGSGLHDEPASLLVSLIIYSKFYMTSIKFI